MAKNFSRGTERIIRALIETLKPRKPGFDPQIEDELLKVADDFIGALPSHMKILFPLGLRLLEYGTLIFVPSPIPFSRMSLASREKYIRGWMESKIALRRDLIKGMKAIAMTGYYAHPEVMKHIGYNLEEHLKRINVVDLNTPPAVPCDAEASQYFKELEKSGKWGPVDGLPGKAKKYGEKE